MESRNAKLDHETKDFINTTHERAHALFNYHQNFGPCPTD